MATATAAMEATTPGVRISPGASPREAAPRLALSASESATHAGNARPSIVGRSTTGRSPRIRSRRSRVRRGRHVNDESPDARPRHRSRGAAEPRRAARSSARHGPEPAGSRSSPGAIAFLTHPLQHGRPGQCSLLLGHQFAAPHHPHGPRHTNPRLPRSRRNLSTTLMTTTLITAQTKRRRFRLRAMWSFHRSKRLKAHFVMLARRLSPTISRHKRSTKGAHLFLRPWGSALAWRSTTSAGDEPSAC
mmetsp:Transcript_113836/g.271041  ORF Transcript_113836/g.271041 Transcript_113836/m.271041 type:complete len:247 (+) Transcript_113836:1026-1766(+)